MAQARRSHLGNRLSMLLLIGGILLVGFEQRADADQNSDRLDFLLKKLDETGERLSHATYRVRYTAFNDRGEWDERMCRKEGIVMCDGVNCYSSFRSKAKFIDPDGKRREVWTDNIGFRNGQQSGFWMNTVQSAYVYDNDEGGAEARGVREHQEVYGPPEIIRQVTGDSVRTLAEIHKQSSAETPWRSSGPDQQGLYVIAMGLRPPKNGDRHVFTIDSRRGWMICKVESFDPNSGRLQGRRTIELMQVPGGWFPKRIEETSARTGKLLPTSETLVLEAALGRPPEGQRFDISALGLRNGVRVIQEDVIGRASAFDVIDGKLVPFDGMHEPQIGAASGSSTHSVSPLPIGETASPNAKWIAWCLVGGIVSLAIIAGSVTRRWHSGR